MRLVCRKTTSGISMGTTSTKRSISTSAIQRRCARRRCTSDFHARRIPAGRSDSPASQTQYLFLMVRLSRELRVVLHPLSNSFGPQIDAPGLYEWFEKWSDKPVRNRGEDYLEFKDKLTHHLMVGTSHGIILSMKYLLFIHSTPLFRTFSASLSRKSREGLSTFISGLRSVKSLSSVHSGEVVTGQNV